MPMSYQRVQNVLYHAPAELTVAERLALVALADRTPGTDPGRTVKFGNDDFAQVLGIQARNIRQVTTRLAARRVEIRVPVAKAKDGEPIYAYRGSVPTYQVPWFPAPDGCLCGTCAEGASANAPSPRVEPEKGCPSTPDTAQEGASHDAPYVPEGASTDAPKGRKGRSSTQKGRSGTPPYQYQPTNQPTLGEEATPSEPGVKTASDPIPPTPTKLPEALRIVVDALADEGITEDEGRAVMRAFVASHAPKGLGLYRKIAEDGGIAWRTHLVAVRAAAKEAAGAAIAELRRGPRCPHGEPGGDRNHPTTGQPLCPLCRAGAPATPTNLVPDPVETYRKLHRAAHGEPTLDRMAAIARQRDDLRQRGATLRQIEAVAAGAACAGTDLVTHLRTESDRASA